MLTPFFCGLGNAERKMADVCKQIFFAIERLSAVGEIRLSEPAKDGLAGRKAPWRLRLNKMTQTQGETTCRQKK
jgi:hypothetical protein